MDIEAGARAVDAYRPLVEATTRPGVMGGIGSFAGLFDPRAAGYEDPLLVAATDGVGTKLMVAIEAGRHDTVGIDLVAMCVNDLVVQGAEPLFFLDYFATARLDPGHARAVVAGIAKGCEIAGCALIGGETAEMPGLYRDQDYDLAGFAVGAVERSSVLTGADVAAGDVLVGLESSGVHSNGFSLIRRLVADQGADLAAPAPFAPDATLADALLEPTRIYVAALLPAVRRGLIKGLAHITGGGFEENVPRMLPAHLAAEIDGTAWSVPAVFRWLAEVGGIAPAEMARTFNCGIAMIAAVAPDHVETVIAALEEGGQNAHRIGTVVPALPGSGRVRIGGLDFG